jgi:hypothetical protein
MAHEQESENNPQPFHAIRNLFEQVRLPQSKRSAFGMHSRFHSGFVGKPSVVAFIGSGYQELVRLCDSRIDDKSLAGDEFNSIRSPPLAARPWKYLRLAQHLEHRLSLSKNAETLT